MHAKLVDVDHKHEVKITARELDALLSDYEQAIDGIKIAEDHWVNLWCDVDPAEYVVELIENGHGNPEAIKAALAERDDE